MKCARKNIHPKVGVRESMFESMFLAPTLALNLIPGVGRGNHLKTDDNGAGAATVDRC